MQLPKRVGLKSGKSTFKTITMRLVPVKNFNKPDDVGYIGRDCEYEVNDGERLRIEIPPDGAKVLDVTPPPGKRWRVYINVSIKELPIAPPGEENHAS